MVSCSFVRECVCDGVKFFICIHCGVWGDPEVVEVIGYQWSAEDVVGEVVRG